MKAIRATGELGKFRKELSTGSCKEGVERCTQTQMRDRAQVFVCLVLLLYWICLAIGTISSPSVTSLTRMVVPRDQMVRGL